MQQIPGSQYRLQFGVKGWAAIVLGIAILVATLIAVAFLAISLLVFALPVMLVAPVLFYFMPKRKVFFVGTPGATGMTNTTNESTPGTIIDGSFRVIDAKPPK